MASIRTEPNGRKSILVICPDRKRRTIRLTTTKETAAIEAEKRIQELSDRVADGEAISRATSRWLVDIPDVVRVRLERAGLIDMRPEQAEALAADEARKAQAERATVKQLTDRFLKSNSGNKGSTQTTYSNIIRNLHAYFGEGKLVQEITEQDASEFRAWLKRQGNIRNVSMEDRKKHKGKPMEENTVRRRTGLARQVFKVGVRAKWISENPFEGLASAFKRNASRDVYIPPETIRDCIDAANNCEWRVIFALSGFAGLRGASEILTLRWENIDFTKGAIGEMVVRSPKTEHHEGHESRVVPIFPDLLPYLREAEQLAEQIANDEGRTIEYVIDSYGGEWENRNLNTQAGRIIKRAGHGPITKIFPNLRASSETDLIGSHEFDINDIAAWWGHSVEVSLKHYSRRREEHAKAGLLRLEAKTRHSDLNAAHASGTELGCTGLQDTASVCREDKKARKPNDSRAIYRPGRT